MRQVSDSLNPLSGEAAASPRPEVLPVRRSRLIGERYQLINELGHGGMGSVYRVLDRLTGRIVTLKKLKVYGPRAADGAADSRSQDRMALAQEFRLLASLRHPNIISVLDYGFDEEHRPFFTMDLQEHGRTIIEAGQGQAIAVQVDLLVQTLRALMYLHRHGIIHCDLKPENILVVRDQVKVLDFGLSVYREWLSTEAMGFAGTLAYTAPEILNGASPSERSDLYAIAMIAYELFAGEYPFRRGDPVVLCREILRTRLPRPSDHVDSRVWPVLKRLLAKDPADRFQDAGEVIAAFATSLEQPLSMETVATRESFLQAAPFIGRRQELTKLTEILRDAQERRGSAWLVGGESGVGKSRLLDEMRTRALVEGMVVVRGEAMSQGGGPYHLWREVISHLILHVDLEDGRAAVLKAIIPDVSALLGRDVPDAPPLDSEAVQSRLLLAVEHVLRLQPRPVLVILEDLQWAGSESLKLLSWLAGSAESFPAALVGSFRNDEVPELPQLVGGANVLTLRRLDAAEIAALGEAVIGPAGRRRELIEFLERETEGIPFFIVEVVRTLAEGAGRLASIGDASLPSRVLSGGMQKVIQRRLSQVPGSAFPALKTAAVIGRAVDANLLRAIHPQVDLDEWGTQCAAAAVLELRDQQWQFAHDKLREQLLEDLPASTRQLLHRQVAEAIEAGHPGPPERVTALAHHWRHAGEPAKEADYARQAGFLALQSGACQEAIRYLTRTLELLGATGEPASQAPAARSAGPRPGLRWGSVRRLLDPNARVDPDSDAFRFGTVEAGLAEGYFRVGDLTRCREHGERALVRFGYHVPRSRLGWILDVPWQAAVRGLQEVAQLRAPDALRARHVATEVARAQTKIIESCFYALRLSPLLAMSLRLLNQCEPVARSVELATAYMYAAIIAGAVPATALADRWNQRALELVEQTGGPRDVAWMLSRSGVLQFGTCQWDLANAGFSRGARLAAEVGDVRLWAECLAQLGAVALYSGFFGRGLAPFREARQLGRRSGNPQAECWGLMGEADCLVRMGRNHEAIPLYCEAHTLIDEAALKTEAIWANGMLGLAQLRTGNREAAYEAAARALSYVREAPPVAFWIQSGMAATAEVFLLLLESGWRAQEELRPTLVRASRGACGALQRFARRFPLGQPHAALWEGLRLWLGGHEKHALRLWRRTIAAGEQLHTRYELTRAHLEIGRHLPQGDTRRGEHLRKAVEMFGQLDCATELEWARAELDRPGAAGVPAWLQP